MYKISYHHCNKCLYQSLWNIALKDIKNHSPHKMTWMEKVSKQSTILHSSHSTCQLNSIGCLMGGPGGQATNTTSSAQHATSLGSISRANLEWGDTGHCVWWLFQPSFNCRLHWCITCEPAQKIKKSSSIFSFLTFCFIKCDPLDLYMILHHGIM